jgi:hypothetical protein
LKAALSFRKNSKGGAIAMVTSTVVSNKSQVLSLEEWMENPPVSTQLVLPGFSVAVDELLA